MRTLVLVLRHKDLPHGQFRAESKGSNISYPDRRVRPLLRVWLCFRLLQQIRTLPRNSPPLKLQTDKGVPG